MNEVEYVAVVRIERVERRLESNLRSRTAGSETKVVRDKAEVLTFTVRDTDTVGLRSMIVGVLTAGLPGDQVKGDNADEEDEEEDETF